MRIQLKALQSHLEKGLRPCYLLSGDEPLQLGEASDAVRARAREEGFATRALLEVDRSFDWNRLAMEADTLSLFSDKKVIDLRIPSGKPGSAGGAALVAYASRPPPDTVLLITLPKLERAQQGTRWFKALDQLGVVLQIWPVEGAELPRWLEQRMRARGLQPDREVAAILAERVEGNLLAAVQEIDKLLLIHGAGQVSAEQLLSAIADSARYDVFKLMDAALAGDAARSLRILEGLRIEGLTDAVLVLWALAREVRLLASVRGEVERGTSPQRAVAQRHDVWEKRRALVLKGVGRLPATTLRMLLQRCALADRAIKGQSSADPWLLFQEIVVALCGVSGGALPQTGEPRASRLSSR